MARRVVLEKLESLHRCIQRIEDKRPENADDLYNNWDLQDILAVNLTRAVQLSVDLAAHVLSETGNPVPQTMAASFDGLQQTGILPGGLTERMKAAVGFRNIAVHAYQTVDWDIVFSIAHKHLGDFQHFAQIMKDTLTRDV